MSTTVKIVMNPTQKILLARALNKNGAGQVKFTKECAKNFDGYVPYLTGRLKNMMITIETNKIIYSAPYAKKQYYTNKGMGRQGNSLGGKRGKFWDKRSWVDNGNNIIQTIARFCGGHI